MDVAASIVVNSFAHNGGSYDHSSSSNATSSSNSTTISGGGSSNSTSMSGSKSNNSTSSSTKDTQATNGKNNNNKGRRIDDDLKYMWYIITAVTSFLILLYLTRLTYNFIRKRRALAARRKQAASEKADGVVAETTVSGNQVMAGSYLGAAITAYRQQFLWREWAIGMWKQSPSEAFFSASYLAAMLALGLWDLPLDEPLKKQAKVVGNKCGELVYCQLPFIVGLAGKNNVISYMTGISYEKLNFLHRSAGRAALILSWIHTVARGMIIPMKGKHAITTWEMQMGVVALIAQSLLTGFSIKAWLPRLSYELFILSHVLFALLFIIGCWAHWAPQSYWILPALVIWSFDRVARLIRTVLINKLWLSFASKTDKPTTGTVEVIPGPALKLTLSRSVSWTPGQHAFIVCPSVSRFPLESHPFTIASIPSHDSTQLSAPTFLICARDGFTGRLLALAQENGGKVEVPCWFDGPYGSCHSLSSFSAAVLVSGGSGVAYTLPQLQEIVRQAKLGQTAVRVVTFVWIIRTVEHMHWISSTLQSLLAECPPSLVIDLKIHVTFSDPSPTTAAIPVLGASADASGRTTPTTSDGSTSENSDSLKFDEKVTEFGSNAPLAYIKGRPDMEVVLRDAIRDARGSVGVRVCGPGALASSVRKALVSSSALTLGDVASGRAGDVDLHVEDFGW